MPGLVPLRMEAAQASVFGKNGCYLRISNMAARSRPLNVPDDMMETFFYGIDPIGQSLYIDDIHLTVVGLLLDKNTLADVPGTAFTAAVGMIFRWASARKASGLNALRSM